MPPLIQCSTWWASQALGGRRQPGKAQCPSRATSASQIPMVTSRFQRPTSSGIPSPPMTIGTTSASQQSRRTAATDSSSPVSRVAVPTPAFRLSQSTSTRTRGFIPWSVGQHLRVQRLLTRLDQGVPGAGAVVALVASLGAALGVGRRQRRGQGLQGGLDDRGVLDGAAPADLHPADPVVDDGEEPVQVRGPLQLVELLLLALGHTVGVERLEQGVAGDLQLGGVEVPGLLAAAAPRPPHAARCRPAGRR